MALRYQDPPEYRDSGGGGGLHLPRMMPVTKRLLIVNGAVFLFFTLIMSWSGARSGPVYGFMMHLALNPSDWFELPLILPLWQLVTYGFLHDLGSVSHILFNMLGLYFFGTLLEEIIGSRRLLWVYLLALAFGGVVQLTVNLLTGSTIPTIGASGGVLCVVVAAAVLRPTSRVIFFFVPMTLKTMAMIMVGLNVFMLLTGGGGRTAIWVHLSGAAWGFVAARKGVIWKDPLETWQASREAHVQRSKERDEQRLDRLLKQISDSGIHSLSRGEREFLKRVSSRR